MASSAAPSVEEMARERSSALTLGEARQYAQLLPAHTRESNISGCYKVRSPSCPGCCLGCAFPLECCGCAWTPASLWGLDIGIGLCFCNCRSADYPGGFTCTDMKANTYSLVKVNGEKGTLAWFSDNEACGKGDMAGVSCYCEKC